MANIVVGVFDEYANAELAREELLAAGMSEEHVRIAKRQPTEPQRDEVAKDHDKPAGFWDNIRDYFGIDDADDDSDGKIDRDLLGGGVLTVIAPANTMDMIVRIMEHHEPRSIDQQNPAQKRPHTQRQTVDDDDRPTAS